MRFFRTRLHAHIALVLLVCLVIAGVVILLLPRERVTRANFEKIEVTHSPTYSPVLRPVRTSVCGQKAVARCCRLST